MPVAADAPFADDEIAALLDPFFPKHRVLLAVSGGPDSMAMLSLTARWRATHPATPIEVATVDHGLRPESADEAALVARVAEGLGLPHATIVWDGPKPSTGLQEAARDARMLRLVRHAMDRRLDRIAYAHTLNDQAETVLMRLIGGSGVGGLRGMDAEMETWEKELRFVRPLLAVPKSRLVAHLEREGVPYATDPTNEDTKYLRPRLRKTLMPMLAAEGLGAERLALIGRKMGRADDALDWMTRDLFDGPTTWRIDRGRYMRMPLDIRLRALEQLIDRIDGGRSLPEDAQLLRIDDAIMAHPTAQVRRTLRRCLLEADRHFVQVRHERARRTG